MNQKIEKTANILNWCCMGVMALLLVLHFMPYWNVGGEQIGLQSFIWLPNSYRQLKDYFILMNGSFDINSAVGLPILIFSSAIVGIVICVLQRESLLAAACPILCGISGLIGYTTNPILVLGSNTGVHIAVCVVLLVLAVALLALRIVELFQEE